MPMKRPMIGLVVAAMLMPLAACDENEGGPRGYGPPPPRSDYYDNGAPSPGNYYDRDAPLPPPDYDAARDYRDEQGQERVLSRDDRVYRGSDGRYYCKRSDGTTGTVVGAIAGGALGAILGGGGALGTLLGAGGGALLGHSIDQGQVRCR